MKRWRVSINVIGVIAGAIMATAMFFPWWAFRLAYTETTNLYPYVIDGPMTDLIGYTRSPQMLLLTGVLIASILLCFLGSVLKGKISRIILAVSGVLVFLGAWRLIMRVTDVAARFGLPAQGHGMGTYGGFAKVEVWTWFQPGLFIIILGGIMAILASILVVRIPGDKN